ncbi:thioredoxin family protein [Priestia koreensis]|uniref:thioredoxin family protein n=1 Tax=Priestia koreensis TaxID=284581 RepID=UPI003457A3A0
MPIKEVHGKDFDNEIRHKEKVLVCFFAKWCSICSTLFPTLENISNDVEGKIEFVKVDIDENPQLVERFNIVSVPSLLLMEKGNVTKKLVNSELKEKILAQLF